ncbi:MAG: hypothetical protein HXY46_09095 [Syntrophaceae bacterium]|nr:hypothetical protein [Syntrophaceae bacterium]
MKIKKLSYVFAVLLLLGIWSISPGWAQSKPTGSPPVITHSFAVEKGPYGYVWRLYIEAEDPDGDMLKIASVVRQTGYGHYPTDWIFLKPDQRRHLKGYIEWSTYSSKAPSLTEWTRITLTVSVLDQAGNESNEVSFPFTFESGVKNPYQYKAPPPFDQGNLPRLGRIFIDLFEPLFMGGGDNRSD